MDFFGIKKKEKKYFFGFFDLFELKKIILDVIPFLVILSKRIKVTSKRFKGYY